MVTDPVVQVGHCQPYLDEGASCVGAPWCLPGLVCRRSDAHGTFLCRRPGSEDAFCNHDRDCGGDLICASHTCKSPRAQGEPCDTHTECAGGLFCSGGACTPRGGAGTPCSISGEGPLAFNCAQCELGLDCDAVIGVCAAPKLVDEGAECTASTLLCDDEHLCRGARPGIDGGAPVLGRCERKVLGASCAYDEDCPDASYCDTSDGGPGSCAAAGLGSRCTQDSDCLGDHYCEGHKECRPLRGPGELCDINKGLRCEPGLPCLPRGAESRCLPWSGLGERCEDDAHGLCVWPYECAGGVCVEAGYLDEPCLSDGGCVQGACFDGTCKQGDAPGGAPCTSGGQCASGWCELDGCRDVCW